MTIIKNIQPLSAESLYHELKKEFPTYINGKLDSELTIDFAHVYDVINVYFPEVLADVVMTITVTLNEIMISDHTKKSDFNTELLEKYLIEFIKLKAE